MSVKATASRSPSSRWPKKGRSIYVADYLANRTSLIYGVILVLAMISSRNPAFAVLNGFELEDGYRLFQRDSSHPDFIAAPDTQIKRINLNAYNAGQYGTNLGGPGGGFEANGPSVPSYSNAGLWVDLNDGTEYGFDGGGDKVYIIAHDDHPSAPAFSGLGMLGMRTTDSSKPLDFAYTPDSRDFYNGGNPMDPRSVSDNAVVNWSIRACPTTGSGDGDSYFWTFRDSAGQAAGQVGWTLANELIYRNSEMDDWTRTGFTVDDAHYDRFDFSFDVKNDTWELSVYDESNSKTVPIFSSDMGSDLSNLARIDWHLEPGIYKTFFDDSSVSSCFTGATPLSVLLDGAPMCSGDKTFTQFAYSPIGDMPTAEDVLVHPITDDDGNFGVRFQGAFADMATGSGSDALIEFKVEAPEGKLIKDVHLEANPAVLGGDGFVSITETFLPQNDEIILTAYDIQPGSRQLHQWADLVDENGDLAPVQSLHIQKDIITWAQSEGAVATMSFIDQTFSQCEEDPEAPGECLEAIVGGGVADPPVTDGGDTQPTGVRSNREQVVGDANSDWVVDARDLNIVAQNWQSSTATGWSQGDFNDDGLVDGTDLNALGLNWGESISAAPVPEPSGQVLLLGVFTWLGFIRRPRSIEALVTNT